MHLQVVQRTDLGRTLFGPSLPCEEGCYPESGLYCLLCALEKAVAKMPVLLPTVVKQVPLERQASLVVRVLEHLLFVAKRFAFQSSSVRLLLVC